jgi:hypothetical protein
MQRTRFLLLGLLVPFLAVGCQDDIAAPEVSDDAAATPEVAPSAPASLTTAQVGEKMTEFQRSIRESIAQRKAQGLPVPSDVSFEYDDDTNPPRAAAGEGAFHVQGPAHDQITVTAQTFIHFDNPAQAGKERWPDFVVEGEVPPDAEGFIEQGDYTRLIMDKMEEASPGIWDQYEYGTEPRTYRFEETYTITYEDSQREAGIRAAEAVSTATSMDEILMGFTLPGLDLDYTVGGYCCADAFGMKAGFALGWGIGLRLPMDLSLSSTEPMAEGSTFWPTSTATGVDWEAADFAQAGVDPEDGDEFVMHFDFFAGIVVTVLWIDVVDLSKSLSIDESASFATPFGSGATFDLPSLNVTVLEADIAVAYASIGFKLTPQAGSDRYTAGWLASGDASGSGSLTYTSPTLPAALGPVLAIDGPGSANLQLDGFQYHFTTFLLDLSLDIYGEIFGEWGDSWTPHLYTFNLSDWTGGLHVGVHSGTPGTLGLSIPITNVAPTAVINRNETVVINGTPTFLAHSGEKLTFTGRATDPGADDLVLSWDWDDGPPSPDMISTPYPPPPYPPNLPPYEVTESQSHVFGDACLYRVGFMALDDDGGVGEDHVPVIITEVGNRARSEGYWQHQFGGQGRTDFEPATLECFLAMVDHMSAVFGEERNISGLQAAHDVLFLGRNEGSAVEQLDRDLLVAWLNFASGATSYWQELDTRGGAAAAFFADIVATAEDVRLDPGSTTREIKEQTSILHHITQMAR